jgi:hypothetical protein
LVGLARFAWPTTSFTVPVSSYVAIPRPFLCLFGVRHRLYITRCRKVSVLRTAFTGGSVVSTLDY